MITPILSPSGSPESLLAVSRDITQRKLAEQALQEESNVLDTLNKTGMIIASSLDLQTLVEQQGPQAPARVADLLAQLCDGLAAAHGAGLIHRDIKPANIVLCERQGDANMVKLLDFGLTRELDEPTTEVTRSDVQPLVGTPLYLSPEALLAPHTMDGRSDLYAVGAVGYYLLTGTPPFSGRNLLDVCAQHLHTQPVPPSQRRQSAIPARLEALILSCLEKSMDRRPRNAASLRDALLPFARATRGSFGSRELYLSAC
jgi:serine/threonine protein kinase